MFVQPAITAAPTHSADLTPPPPAARWDYLTEINPWGQLSPAGLAEKSLVQTVGKISEVKGQK